MTLTINGESRELEDVATLADVLDRLGLDPRTVVVEHNRAIIRRPSLAVTSVSAGDQLEIVHFVGGG
jgi:thiamine biosynthesis protein ThiS